MGMTQTPVDKGTNTFQVVCVTKESSDSFIRKSIIMLSRPLSANM